MVGLSQKDIANQPASKQNSSSAAIEIFKSNKYKKNKKNKEKKVKVEVKKYIRRNRI